jgi:uncharacterized RDD family membrane protein YckC
MSQINCPHCGFVNFAISAYCGRCERPLRDASVHTATTVVTAAPLGAPATPAGGTAIRSAPPPARHSTTPPSARPTAPLSPPSVPPPRPTVPTGAPTGGPLLQRLTPRRTGGATSDSVATPPEVATLVPEPRAPAPVPVPMEVDDTVIPARPAGLPALGAALLIDLSLTLAVGAALAGLEALVFDSHWPADRTNFWEALAAWMHLHAGTVVRATTVMALFAVGYSAWGAQRGRTLGRAALGLWVLRHTGEPLGWGRAVLRGTLELVSALAFGAGFFWMMVDAQHRSWADVLSGAVVVSR